MTSIVNVLGTFSKWLDDNRTSMSSCVQGDINVLREGESELYPQISWDMLNSDGWDENRLQKFLHLALHVKVDAKDEYGFYLLKEFLSGMFGFSEHKTPVNAHASVEIIPVKNIIAGTLPENTTTRVGNLEIRAMNKGWTDYSTDSTYKAFRSILIYF